MFSNLAQNSVFYILDKNGKPSLKIGKVVSTVINPQYYGLANQEMDIDVDVNGDSYKFKKIPANLSIVSPSNGIVVSDNSDDITREVETMISISENAIKSIDYHKAIVSSKDELLSILNPRFAKEKEQELKLNTLASKVSGMEQGISEIKSMLQQVTGKLSSV